MLSPIDLIWWALAAVVVAFAIFLIVSIIVATVRTIRKPRAKPDHIVLDNPVTRDGDVWGSQ